VFVCVCAARLLCLLLVEGAAQVRATTLEQLVFGAREGRHPGAPPVAVAWALCARACKGMGTSRVLFKHAMRYVSRRLAQRPQHV